MSLLHRFLIILILSSFVQSKKFLGYFETDYDGEWSSQYNGNIRQNGHRSQSGGELMTDPTKPNYNSYYREKGTETIYYHLAKSECPKGTVYINNKCKRIVTPYLF